MSIRSGYVDMMMYYLVDDLVGDPADRNSSTVRPPHGLAAGLPRTMATQFQVTYSILNGKMRKEMIGRRVYDLAISRCCL